MSRDGDAGGGALAWRMVDRATAALGVVSATALAAMLVVMTLDVIGREALSSPLTGALELVEIALAITIFAALPQVAWREEHITADLFDAAMGPRLRRGLRALGGVIGAGVLVVALPRLATLAERSADFGDATPQLSIPMAWTLWAIWGLVAATALAFLALALRMALGGRPEEAEPAP